MMKRKTDKKLAPLFLSALLALSGCAPRAEISESIPTAETEREETTAETLEQSEPPTDPTLETETAPPESGDTAETEQSETAPAETIPAETEQSGIPEDIEDWRRAYVEYLNGLDFIGGGVLLDDINSDGTPEAVVATNDCNQSIILYYNENGLRVLELPIMSCWGYVRYEPETGRIFHCAAYGHTDSTYGLEECYVYDWNGSDYVRSLSLFREAGYVYYDENREGHGRLGQAYINGEAVDNDAFEKEFDDFYAVVCDNLYFPVVKVIDENFEEYMRENFPGFNNWENTEPMRW